MSLRWSDFDAENKTLRIGRSLDKAGRILTFKLPKTGEKGIRTIAIADELVELLKAEREKHQRLVASIPDGADVDPSLVKLPSEALIFPSFIGAKIDLTKPRDPATTSLGFIRRARKIGFAGLRFHDLRGTHETALLDAGCRPMSSRNVADIPSR